VTGRRVFLLACLTAGAIGLVTVLALRGSAPAPPYALTSGKCHSLNGLPDPICTPGVADPRVTQDNIQTTICVSGYTAKVRPASAYTSALKRQQISDYGYADVTPADYEEDHLIPLELGGAPADPRNLWPEPRSGDYTASEKDRVENALHAKVCAGLATLAAAQASIARDWESA
jgi:hypothetical protein